MVKEISKKNKEQRIYMTPVYTKPKCTSRLEATQIKFWRIEWSSLERWSFSIPGLFKCFILFLFISSWQTLHFSLLLIHDFSDRSLGLIIEILELFWVVDFGSVNLRISNKDSAPDFLLSLFEVEIQIIFSFESLDFPHRLCRIDFFIKFTFDQSVSVFVLDRDMFGVDFNFQFFCFDLRINFQGDFDFADLLAPRVFLVFSSVVCINKIDICWCCLILFWFLYFWRLWLIFWWYLLRFFLLLLFGLGYFWGCCGLLGFLRGWCFLLLLRFFVYLEFLIKLFNWLFRESFVMLLLKLLKNA